MTALRNRRQPTFRTAPVARIRGGKAPREGEEGGVNMAKAAKKYENMTTEEKIARVVRSIKVLFREIPDKKRKFVDSLIYQYAVTTVTLERLVAELNNDAILEDFKQGSQQFRRESPALRGYNTTIKSFTSLVNQLIAQLPEDEKKNAGDELMNFVMKPPKGVSA